MIWEILLGIKEALKQDPSVREFISVSSDNTNFTIWREEHHPDEFIVIYLGEAASGQAPVECLARAPFCLQVIRNERLSSTEHWLLETYLPYALLPYFSHKLGKCFSISHFAQTLDGRIATNTGHSRGIGNEANLLHAHKMRALCDAILIGAKTLKVDNPRLNVRLVNGKDPIKVILGGDELSLDDYNAVDASSLIFCHNHQEIKNINAIRLPKTEAGYEAKEILSILYQKGMNSVYVEGGAYTTSSFLQQGAIDQVQVHISPRILGSGITGFEFKGIQEVSEAIEFRNGRFIPMEAHIMFVGER